MRVYLVVSMWLVAACSSKGVPPEALRTMARRSHEMLKEDAARHLEGIDGVSERVAPLVYSDRSDVKMRNLRLRLRKINQPPKGVPALFASSLSFVAVVDTDGRVLSRDIVKESDAMSGKRYDFDILRDVRKTGQATHATVVFSEDKSKESNWLFVSRINAPKDGQGVDASALSMLGMPFWRLSQRLTNQLRHENKDKIPPGTQLWALMVHGGEVQASDVAPELLATLKLQKANHASLNVINTFRFMHRDGAFIRVALPEVGQEVSVLLVRVEK